MKIDRKYLEQISKNPFFEGFDEQKILEIISLMHGKTESFGKGEFLHNDYERYEFFGLLLEGGCEACIDDIDGNKMIMREISVGTTFAESLAFLKAENSPVYILANRPSVVLWLDPEVLFGEKKDKLLPVLQKRFTKALALRPLVMNSRIQVLSKPTLRKKIIAYLSGIIPEKNSKTITVPLNREDMATYIGTNRTALSRELSKMKKEGIIDFKKNVFYILK
ncbi:MAG: Crp/Fnr family transcriptional regulator [Clostridia bacterium]|nr:Crp/Fnr family transcriptional regulator [Clostridia bacterium]